MKFNRILVPVDFSEQSHVALMAADALAISSESSLTLLHVNPITNIVVLDWSYVAPAEEIVRMATAAEEGLQRWDYSAASLIVSEAGGNFLREEDSMVFAAGPALFGQLHALVRSA